ncbi:threonine-phosphate decarboxylase CobD [Ketobacter sp.]|uniref:threonine-phosphate decarboxylase CobD n=1 Tax=Ketobacter sp. TaxID=2083498 RepID=UPI000F2C94D8|nr:threonine-phosphate decarboxylase CobD [Ketobacter sp.]RLU00400.1 MAG: threonine-phosphate decarboxylase [Ketobacter sp.]
MSAAPLHGGRLLAAAEQFRIPLNDWLDLSTGINPTSWPVPALPDHVWQRLPDSYAPLEAVAGDYYGAPVFAVPGSQWAIQTLPSVLNAERVWLPLEGYEEHQYWWQQYQHRMLKYETLDSITPQHGDSVVVINPNNPTTHTENPETLLRLADHLTTLQGHLILDEAFVDPTPHASVLHQNRMLPDSLVVLRSLGKFFGLAGVRLGFVYCNDAIRARLQPKLGPWAISHPAAWIGEQALQDTQWHRHARAWLMSQQTQLHGLLQQHIKPTQLHSTPLFCTVQLPSAKATDLFNHCAGQGILLRHFPQWDRIRVGITTKNGLERLQSALQCWDL